MAYYSVTDRPPHLSKKDDNYFVTLALLTYLILHQKKPQLQYKFGKVLCRRLVLGVCIPPSRCPRYWYNPKQRPTLLGTGDIATHFYNWANQDSNSLPRDCETEDLVTEPCGFVSVRKGSENKPECCNDIFFTFTFFILFKLFSIWSNTWG